MDTTARRRKIQKVITDSVSEVYKHDVNMYSDPPMVNEIPLSEFEELALERLELLRFIEQATVKGLKPFSDEWKKSIKEDLAKNGLKRYLRLMNAYGSQTEHDFQARRADHLSHFILRLAYCRSDDLRRWFLAREMEWFKLRFISLNQNKILEFLHENNLTYTPISNEEKEDIKNELIMCTPGVTDVFCEMNDFYKVPFQEVVPLVKNRRVVLKRGYAFIAVNDLVVCVQSKFRASLSEALNIYCHKISFLDDERVNSMLVNLHNSYTGNEYNVEECKDSVNPANLDEYSKKHFPMCMRYLHEVLKSTHKLKHFSRLQYGFYLKGIGVLYEHAMEFWRQEFTKAIDNDKFDKQYSYTFKHMYGKVGNMTNYSPYSCIKLIMTSVGPGDHHGCPFKHWDHSVIKNKLSEHGLSSEGVNSVMELTQNGHYQIACTKYFECTQGQAPSTSINHPNQYFVESMNLVKEKQKK